MYHSLKVNTDIAHGLTCRRLLRGTSLVLTTVLEIKVMAVCRSLAWVLPVIRPARHHYVTALAFNEFNQRRWSYETQFQVKSAQLPLDIR